MKFSGKTVRSLTKIIKAAGSAREVRFAVPIGNVSKEHFIELGFDEHPKAGDYLIPSVIGKVTAFNARGNIVIRKDLPKEPESVMFYGASRDWQGGIHHSIRTRTMHKYPRDYVPAPSEPLEIIEIQERLFISSSDLNLDEADETRNIHVANLMLECFSEFEIFDNKNYKIVSPTFRGLNWDVLPPGEYPWEKSKNIIFKATERLDKKEREVIEYRMRVISRRKPDFLATGRAGFNGYFVYGFKNKGVYVLESIYLDNATYVFDSDWEKLSKLTKSEIINSKLPHKRIIHNKKWSTEVGRAIDGKRIQ